MLLVKLPVPVPLLVLVASAMVGFGAGLQTTPRAVTAAPPSEEMVPPLLAVAVPMALTAVVLSVGVAVVVKETSFPYAIPPELMAYALT